MSDILYTYYKTYGNKILLKYRKDGKSNSKFVDFYKPTLYLKSNIKNESDTESVFGDPLNSINFETIKEAKEFAEQYKSVDGIDVFGNSNFANQFIIELYKGASPSFDKDSARVGIIDIETDSLEMPDARNPIWPINAVTVWDSFTDTYYCMGMKEFVFDPNDENIGKLNVVFSYHETEDDMLRNLLMHFKEKQYDITSGWNSEGFDMPYIVKRCYSLLGENFTVSCLSPFKTIYEREKTTKYGTSYLAVDIYGLPHLDYLSLYRKHITTPRESYKLDFIAQEELNTKKLSYEEEGSLKKLYEQNPQKFFVYNIIDVNIIKRLDDKLGLFNVSKTLAYYSLSNFEDTLATVKIWEQMVAKHLYNKNQVPPFNKKENHRDSQFEGAFVHPTQVGHHPWTVSVDLNSLYPFNEIQYNIGIETHIPRNKLPKELAQLKAKHTLDDLINEKVDLSVLKKYDYVMTGNFEFYRKDKISFMAEIKEEIYSDRKKRKKQMLKHESNVQLLKEELKRRGISK